ncbi:MAG: response regulator [Gemmatimonadetes bacterium]|nr:response regulator [Gemmatimonadota bacterium]
MAEILIIDDEPGVLGILKKILESAGHSVSEAAEGEAALRQYEGRPADLVITDIFMPGMDGIEFLVHIRKTFPEARVLAMSGGGLLSRDQALSDAALLGADGILQKPFTKDEVLEAVARTMTSNTEE